MQLSYRFQVPPFRRSILKAATHQWSCRHKDRGHAPEVKVGKNFFHFHPKRIRANPQSGGHRTAADPVEPAP
ncbi:hypothetical protein D3C85_1799290 [compost metagenome]